MENQVALIVEKYRNIAPLLGERALRMWAGVEAKAIGYGGQQLVHKATGIAINTIRRGIADANAAAEGRLPEGRNRKEGGGRKRKIEGDQTVIQDILSVVESSTRGDPEAPLLWCSKSLRKISDALNQEKKRVSHTYVGEVLAKEGYSLQVNRKVKEGASSPDRDAQFQFISEKTKAFQSRNQPVISVDTKKKELIGEFKNAGQSYCKKSAPIRVNVHDFIDPEKGKAAPYGVYDISQNKGWVSVGISADTAEFSVNSIRSWWVEMGKETYPEATEIYINADGGGSNGSRVRLWKSELQKLANEIGKTIHVSHFPPGTSKWNKIEHKMFCFISNNWRGKPLTDTATIVQLIAGTTTKKGLTIRSKLDERHYEKGMKVSDETMQQLKIEKDSFHGEWNYKISPQK